MIMSDNNHKDNHKDNQNSLYNNWIEESNDITIEDIIKTLLMEYKLDFNSLINKINMTKNIDELYKQYEVININKATSNSTTNSSSDYAFDNKNNNSGRLLTFINENDIDNDIKNSYIFNDRAVTFNTNIYIKNILGSYHYEKDKILKQFGYDCPRSTIKINNKKINGLNDMINNLDSVKDIKINDNCIKTLDILIIMLCNQSSFAFTYCLLQKLYGKNDNSLIISSHKTKKMVNVNITKDEISIILTSDFALINTKNDEKIINKFDTEMHLTIINKNNKFTKINRLDSLFTDGFLFWK